MSVSILDALRSDVTTVASSRVWLLLPSVFVGDPKNCIKPTRTALRRWWFSQNLSLAVDDNWGWQYASPGHGESPGNLQCTVYMYMYWIHFTPKYQKEANRLTAHRASVSDFYKIETSHQPLHAYEQRINIYIFCVSVISTSIWWALSRLI